MLTICLVEVRDEGGLLVETVGSGGNGGDGGNGSAELATTLRIQTTIWRAKLTISKSLYKKSIKAKSLHQNGMAKQSNNN